MNRNFSSRKIENPCPPNLHLFGYQTPSHNVINRFRKSKLLNRVMEELFVQFVGTLNNADETVFKNLFIEEKI